MRLHLRTLFLLLLSPLLIPSFSAAAATISIVATGDILLAGSAADLVRARGSEYPFAATREYLNSADLTIGNLEFPLTTGGEPIAGKTFTFRGRPELAKGIAAAGFDVLTLANNHIGDYGPEGIVDAVAAVRDAGMASIGAGKDRDEARTPAILERHGKRIAFLGYSNTLPESFWAGKNRPGTAYGNPDWVRADVHRAKQEADLVVVSFHWGAEKMTTPKEYQRELARIAIDAGASVVLGHHPHVLQGAEFYRGGVIFYSLGNFAFGSYSKNARTSMLARIEIDDAGRVSAAILPLSVYNTEVLFQPRPLKGEKLTAFEADYNLLLEPFKLLMGEAEEGWYPLLRTTTQTKTPLAAEAAPTDNKE